MAKYANHIARPKTPQTKRAKKTQVQGRSGGFVFKVDDWTRLNRFLIIGNENGNYYASEREMVVESYDCILNCLKLDSKRTVDTIVQISDEGRAVKNDPALFALAVCSVHGDDRTRAYANKSMPAVARFSTAFFTWVDAVVALKDGRKGKGMLRAISKWYVGKDARTLAYQVCKYPGRSIGSQRWTHADMLRMSHIGRSTRNGKALVIPSDAHATVFNYATHGVTTDEEIAKRAADAESTGKKQKAVGLTVGEFEALKESNDLKYVWAHEKCSKATDIKEVVKLVKDYRLTRESVPPHFRNEMEVQKVLLPGMPMTALIRNLGSMTSSGLLKPLGKETKDVIKKITDEKNLQKGRIHPMTIMLALKVYSSGHGKRTTWEPVSAIKDALEDAFYKSFKYVEPTGKNFLFGIDVSGSMGGFWYSEKEHGMTPREAAAVVAMTCARVEKNYEMMAFAHTFMPLKITAKDSLDTVVRRTSNLNFGGTDCALPMLYALKNELEVDVFVVLTDSESWAGDIHVFEAMKRYRAKINKNAKLAVLAFDANDFSVADPDDAGMMDIVGLDANVPKILSEFAVGNL